MAKRERYRINNEEEQEKYMQQQNEDAGYQNDNDVENYSKIAKYMNSMNIDGLWR
ncbi:uncharacterized protein RAG0_16043 [Rhynchosporium agropyri]|uniref:Uncharacterized protein n=1 Tax=Rhynchosporium agropyri TaxID=914238 RepID=A0A1E1LQE1_9HELO|nr:uncharacterized protein RAG0_16043 [Rhynchosporium agropyri]